MKKKVLVLQHNPWEVPGEYLIKNGEKHKVVFDICKVWQERIPDLEPYDALMVLGGGPNVDEEEKYPFLREEKKVIRNSLNDDRPYIGFCLGHQLLAEALGAKVEKNFELSLGFVTGFLTQRGIEHPLFQDIQCCMPLFKWHAYAVKEPAPGHIEVLATSRECQIEAISVVNRPHIIGLQFDNQSASPNDVAKWLVHDQEWINSFPELKTEPRAILEQAEKHWHETSCEFEIIFENFLGIIADKG